MLPARWRRKMQQPAIGASAFWSPERGIGRNGVSSADNSIPASGRRLNQAFEALIATLNERRVRYAIIGGIAILQHTRVRTTDDIDALLTVPQIAMPGLFEALQA